MGQSLIRRSFLCTSSISMALLLSACAQQSQHGSRPVTTAAVLAGAASNGPITLDGDTADWPGVTPILADENYLYLRFAVEDAQYTLQSAPVTTTIMLDLDADKGTGETSRMAGFDQLGVDLVVEFSPRNGAAVKNGVVIHSVDAAGRRTKLEAADFDFACTPTYASNWYELRLSRTPSNAGLLPERGLRTQGNISGLVALRGAEGRITGYSDPFTTSAPAAATGKALGSADLPVKPEGAVRVMVYNVEKSAPMSKPELFKRIFQATKPDIILLSEWESGDAASVRGWFEAMVGGAEPWNVIKAAGDNSSGGGVAVVTNYPLAQLSESPVTMPGRDANGPRRPVRFVGANVTTPYGDFVVGSTHLKCCGTKDSSEDRTRMGEARAINEYLAGVLANLPRTTVRVIGGDLNLVGSRPPLDLLRAGIDSDASDLSVAQPLVLGDRTMTTWRDPSSGFGPGRLDYLLYSDANADIVNAVVLDTARLNDASLARLGLDRTDSEASDHLPVIVDLKPRR